MPILHPKTTLNRPPRILCSQDANSMLKKIEILCSQNATFRTHNCNNALNITPRKFCTQKMKILHSRNGNSALKNGNYALGKRKVFRAKSGIPHCHAQVKIPC